MARAPNKRVEEARMLYDSGLKLIEISEKLGVPEGTVRSWKNRYKWGGATLQKKKCNVAKKKGGQPGNKNAEGHGGTGPPGNKNAVKTGEFEALFFDTLNPEEQKLIQMVNPDKEKLLLQEIQLLTVRERRMLKRIDALQSQPNQGKNMFNKDILKGVRITEYSIGMDRGKATDLMRYEDVTDKIQSIEEALTRVQARKQKAIETLHKFGYDDAKLDLAITQLEFTMMKQGNQEEEKTDDGFLDAMNEAAKNIWGDEGV